MDPSGHMFLLQTVTETCQILHRMQLIRYNMNTEMLNPTDMGRIASNYYIQVKSMSLFMENLKPNIREEIFLYHMAHSSEFEQLEPRKDELQELKVLAEDCRFVEVDKGEINAPFAKVLLLFEAYLRQRPVRAFSLISDTAYIV